MLIMIYINDDISVVLNSLGKRLKDARLARNETQEVFAARIGITRQSYARMEKGVGAVPLGNWLAASDILGRLDTWQDVLKESKNLFELYESKQQKKKRASGKKG